MAKVLMLLPESDYDPTESGVPWAALKAAGHEVIFATPAGLRADADARLVETGFGLLSPFLMTRGRDLSDYKQMTQDPAFLKPLPYADLHAARFDALLVPGGHAKGVKSLLESREAQACVVEAFSANKPVAAVCHGVLLLARSIDPATGRSVLHGRQTTALIKSMELTAWQLTRLWLKDYYRTYPQTVEDEIKTVLAKPADFKIGNPLPIRDSHSFPQLGFTVCDGNYLSARWPGDCHRMAKEFAQMLA